LTRTTGAGAQGNDAASVLAKLYNTAANGYDNKTTNMTSEATQRLLSDPSAGFNGATYSQAQKDAFASQQAKALEAARQAGANLANTGRQQATQQSTMLQGAMDRAQFGADLDLQVADKTKADQQQAITAGQQTAATEQAGYGALVNALVNAKQAGEGDANREWQSGENSANRQLEKELAAGNITMREKELAQNALQFASKQEYDRWATERGISAEEAARGWQAGENAKDREFEAGMAELERKYGQVGLVINGLMAAAAEDPTGESALQLVTVAEKLAADNGIDIQGILLGKENAAAANAADYAVSTKGIAETKAGTALTAVAGSNDINNAYVDASGNIYNKDGTAVKLKTKSGSLVADSRIMHDKEKQGLGVWANTIAYLYPKETASKILQQFAPELDAITVSSVLAKAKD
jgi:hypothetical protein